jgi:hypothetical protein
LIVGILGDVGFFYFELIMNHFESGRFIGLERLHTLGVRTYHPANGFFVISNVGPARSDCYRYKLRAFLGHVHELDKSRFFGSRVGRWRHHASIDLSGRERGENIWHLEQWQQLIISWTQAR